MSESASDGTSVRCAAPGSRVSTFGFYRAPVEPIGLTDCSDEPGPYAGCMTAPCTGPVTVTNGTATIHCDCPIYDGPFQLGKDGLSCDDAPMAWSAAYNPNAAPPNPCDMVTGGCIPDAPPDQCGCCGPESSATATFEELLPATTARASSGSPSEALPPRSARRCSGRLPTRAGGSPDRSAATSGTAAMRRRCTLTMPRSLDALNPLA